MASGKVSKLVIILFGVILLVLSSVIYLSINKNPQNRINSQYTAEVYYSTTCGCCINYIGYIRSNGFNVKPIIVDNTDAVKDENNIPQNMRSCHTTKIGNYFIEGHIPVEAITKLVQEKPTISGIALPNMPSGSPGMPGRKTSPFTIYGITEGKSGGIFTQV